MIKLKALLSNKWFFPILMLYYGMFYILFGESYPFNEGLCTDGYVYRSFFPDFRNSVFFDTYYVHRIFPSFLLSVFFKFLSISLAGKNIYIAFQILNLTSIVTACYFFKQILVLFKISLKNQLFAFALLLLNFGVIKFAFYLPVMTDTFAMMLSTALLYFYLKNNIIGIVTCTILLAFTWPMAYYQGLLLIAFPICILPLVPPLKWQKILIQGISILYVSVLCVFFVFISKLDNNTIDFFIMKIDRTLLPISILGIVVLYFFFSKLFFNKTLLDKSLFFAKLNYKRLLISIGVFVLVLLIIQVIHPMSTASYSTSQIFSDVTLISLIKPLISIVSDFSYFGIAVCFLILFWSSFCKTLTQMGWGLVAALGMNIFFFGITPESRHLINILPWLIVLLIKAINKYSFKTSFYVVTGLLSFAASKIWLLLNIYSSNSKIWHSLNVTTDNSSLNIDKNGSLGFPSQLLWMNIGPWMSERMYFVQGAVMLLFIAILFFMLYKFQMNEFKKVRLVRRYQILE